MSKLIEAKTMPEIIEVTLVAVMVACSTWGVEATVNTNLGSFKGQCGLPFDIDNELPTIKDLSFAQEKVDNALKNLDPRKMEKVDDILSGLKGITVEFTMDCTINFLVSMLYRNRSSNFNGSIDCLRSCWCATQRSSLVSICFRYCPD